MSRRAVPGHRAGGCVVVALVLTAAALSIASPGPLAFFTPVAPGTGSAVPRQAEGESAPAAEPQLQDSQGGDDYEELVKKVCEMQRSSMEAASAWDGFIARRYSTSLKAFRDPHKQTAQCLRDFLESYERGVRLPATWKLLDDLVKVVPQLDVAWKKRVLSDEKDPPSRVARNSRVAAVFLERLAVASLNAEDHVNNQEHKDLVTRALCFEPSFGQYVKDLGFAQTSPRHYPASFLKAFLEKQPQWTPEHEAALERVKELVRTKQVEWKSYAADRVDVRGRTGPLDPGFHTQDTLEGFISAMETA